MASVELLCSSCLLIGSGRLEAKGEPAQIVMRYMASELREHGGIRSLVDHPGRRAGYTPIMKSVVLFSGNEGPSGIIRMGSPLSIRVEFVAPRPIRPILGAAIKSAEGMPIFGMSNRWTNDGFDNPAVLRGAVICNFAQLPLMPGTYLLELDFGDFGDITRDLDLVKEAVSFEIVAANLLGSGRLPRPIDGPVFWPATWAFDLPGHGQQ
jgi:hypothetical protein